MYILSFQSSCQIYLCVFHLTPKFDSSKETEISMTGHSVNLQALLFDCREDLEKIKSNQDLLESKELAVIVISLFFACVALFKLAWHQIMGLFKPCESHKRREYLLVFVCSSLTMLITLLCNQIFLFVFVSSDESISLWLNSIVQGI